MNKIYDKVKRCYKQVNEMTEFKPQIALVLGSGLGDYADSYPDHLSGGQKQRLAMIRMLAAEPQCILLDEPFSALDEHIKRKMEREVMEMLHDFDKPILFVSHNQEEVYRLADRIGSMENGRFSPIREKRAFFAEPQTVGQACLLYTTPSPRDRQKYRMPSSA